METSMTARRPARGFGVAGALSQPLVRVLASVAERAGYRTFWVNDTPGGDGLAALADAASVTSSIRLGVGVIPLDRQSGEQIVARIDELTLPVDRLTLGIGAGGDPGGLARVRAGTLALREGTSAKIVIGALGPKMCRLAGEVADGVLLNWLTPAHVLRSIQVVSQSAEEAHRSHPESIGYVRTALGEPAALRLRAEGDRYAAIPAYGAHFARMDGRPNETAVIGNTPDEIQSGLLLFDEGLDETVVRAVTESDTESAYRALLDAAAPR